MKIADINKIIRELWAMTYSGEDIDMIEIVSGDDEDSGKAKRYGAVGLQLFSPFFVVVSFHSVVYSSAPCFVAIEEREGGREEGQARQQRSQQSVWMFCMFESIEMRLRWRGAQSATRCGAVNWGGPWCVVLALN